MLDNKIPKKDLDFIKRITKNLDKNMVNTSSSNIYMIVTFLASLGFNATISNKKQLQQNVKEHIQDMAVHKKQIRCALLRHGIENDPFEFPTRVYQLKLIKEHDSVIKIIKDLLKKESENEDYEPHGSA